MIYEGDVYRPPSEGESLIIQLTIGGAPFAPRTFTSGSSSTGTKTKQQPLIGLLFCWCR